MPAPNTADELLDLVHKSGLVEEPKLRAYEQKLRAAEGVPGDPTRMAQFLVRDGLLTYFQAEQLLQGKYKRFSLGKYKVLEKLGSGGMGTVFLCEHKLMRRRVAVKVLPIPKAEDKASLDRFYREARAVAAVDHPNIVRAYDIDQDDNLHFLVMEWVDGVNLQDLVKKSGPLDPLRASHYVYGAAVGLQHAFEIGLIHRDIKPGNILVDRSGVVKILDLGLARLTHDADDNLTRQNDENVLGTADYLAPEQAMDSHTVDIRADIYSLGATFYFLLTGSAPFPEGSVAQKLIWHQTRPPRPLRSLRPEVPGELAAVVERMMAKDPAQRFPTPADVLVDLAPWVSAPIPPPADREMPVLAPAVGGARGGSGGPSTMVGGGPATLAGPRPQPLAVPTAAPTAVGVATPAPAADPGPGVWSSLDTRTDDGDTGRPGPIDLPDDGAARPSARDRRPRARAKGGGKGLVLAALGLLLLGGAGVGVYLAFFRKGDTPPPPPVPATGARKVFVSKTPGEGTVGTLREALAKVGPGDTIVVVEPRLTEPPFKLSKTAHKDVTIESGTADGRPAVIEYGGKGGAMLEATGVEGLRLRNLEFDGKGQAEYGIQFSGIVPGAALEGVTVRGATRAGVRFWEAAGDKDRPVLLDRVRVVLPPGAEAGVLLYAPGSLDNRHVAIRGGRFEGARSGVRFDGPAVEVEVSNGRFYNLPGAGVSFARPSGRPTRAAVTASTFYQTPAGLHFEAPANELGAYTVRVAQSYFAKTSEALKAGGPVKVEGADNGHAPDAGPGNPPLPAAAKLDAPLLPDPNPNDDAAFLRFADPGPQVNGKRAGAQ